MNEIICPHCKKAFKVDETGYADILKQVKDHQFEKEIAVTLLNLKANLEEVAKKMDEMLIWNSSHKLSKWRLS